MPMDATTSTPITLSFVAIYGPVIRRSRILAGNVVREHLRLLP